jgi:hypothetical protein
MKNGKGKRDEHIRELRERGLSLRAIGRRVGLSRMQVSRILDSLATGDPAEVVSVLADADDDDLAAAGPCSGWSVEQQARGYLFKLRHCSHGEMRELILWRLRHLLASDEFAKLCEREGIGRAGT